MTKPILIREAATIAGVKPAMIRVWMLQGRLTSELKDGRRLVDELELRVLASK